ncbi:MAG: hypothetical protein DRI44_02940 [Chlamydiae bacterium]|nr:MAG: hypothetical protein DRI44_02940 [Chlamydiota bacterium]
MYKKGCLKLFPGVVFCLLFYGNTILGANAVPTNNLQPGDLILMKSVPGKYHFYHLWPGNGKRADDPLKDAKEYFDNRIKDVSCPTIMVMKPDNPNGKAVIVFPGGGYSYLAARKEGSRVGEWLNQQGITAFAVKYRVPKRKGVNAPLQDAQRAIRFVRGNANYFGIDPNSIGVMGFSAGGHLCALTVHQFDKDSYSPVDYLDKVSCKPNFCILIYPAYLGERGKVSRDFREVKDSTIPIYVAISKNDPDISNVMSYVPILMKADVPYEFHVYAEGKHGTGLGGFPWIKACEDWLNSQIKSSGKKKLTLKLLEVKKIWDKAPHNAFTDLVRFHNRWFCVFREATSHVSDDGALRVITSADGDKWKSAALIKSKNSDLRDAKISVTPNGNLMLCGAEVIHAKPKNKYQSLSWFSKDGYTWSKKNKIGDANFWLWRVTWHKGKAYGIGYSCGANKRTLRLYSSSNGKKFDVLVNNLYDVGAPNETAIAFNGDTAYCLLRRDGKESTGKLGISQPPYTNWKWKDIGARIGGPQLICLPNGQLIAVVRLYDGGPRTSLCLINAKSGKLTEKLTFPSGGDTSYAGIVRHDNMLWVSYYSSHEGKASIYLSKVKLVY